MKWQWRAAGPGEDTAPWFAWYPVRTQCRWLQHTGNADGTTHTRTFYGWRWVWLEVVFRCTRYRYGHPYTSYSNYVT